MLRAFEPWHLVVIGLVVMVLFGSKKLPDSARSIGQSLRIFKSEMAANKAEPEPAPTVAAQPAAPARTIEPVPPIALEPQVGLADVAAVPVQEPVGAGRPSGA
jgi:sec-independent protein translocase protein TatA